MRTLLVNIGLLIVLNLLEKTLATKNLDHMLEESNVMSCIDSSTCEEIQKEDSKLGIFSDCVPVSETTDFKICRIKFDMYPKYNYNQEAKPPNSDICKPSSKVNGHNYCSEYLKANPTRKNKNNAKNKYEETLSAPKFKPNIYVCKVNGSDGADFAFNVVACPIQATNKN